MRTAIPELTNAACTCLCRLVYYGYSEGPRGTRTVTCTDQDASEVSGTGQVSTVLLLAQSCNQYTW